MRGKNKNGVTSKILTAIIVSVFFANAVGQTSMIGPVDPSVSSVNTGTGTIVWENSDKSFTSDNTYTSANATIVGDVTEYLFVSGFGFSIPPTATIDGIEIVMEKGASGVLQNVTDNSVKIVKAGSVSGTEHARGDKWNDADTNVAYGSPTDNWGAGWSPSDINDPGFGVAISASLAGSSELPAAHVDHISITVHFTIPLPIEVFMFEASRSDQNKVNVSWGTISEVNNDFFTLERSIDAENWEAVKTIDGAGDHNGSLSYHVEDVNPYKTTTYYRLKQTDFDGNFRYYKFILDLEPAGADEIRVFPNPNLGVFSICVAEDNSHIEIFGSAGRKVFSQQVSAGTTEIDVSFFLDDVYSLRITSAQKVSTLKLMKHE